MILAQPLHVGHPLASVLCPNRRGLREQLISRLWLTLAGERKEYGNQTGMGGEPEAAEAGVTSVSYTHLTLPTSLRV